MRAAHRAIRPLEDRVIGKAKAHCGGAGGEENRVICCADFSGGLNCGRDRGRDGAHGVRGRRRGDDADGSWYCGCGNR
jgi:hypothetical protein